MNILVTGATGLIGSHLCKILAQEHMLIALTRNPIKAAQQLPCATHCISSLKEVNFNDIDVVINLAGEPIADKRWNNAQKNEIKYSRLKITSDLVSAIKDAEHPPHTFISGSAIGYYGRHSASTFIDESFTDVHKEFSHELCKVWEDKALEAESQQTRVCLLRTGIVLCNNAGALKKMYLPFKLGLGGKVASGEQMMSWIHINDIINMLVTLINHPELSGVFNATAPNPVDNQTFTRTLARVLNRPAFFPMPEFVLKLMFGEMSDLLIYGQAVYPTKFEKLGFNFEFDHLKDALSDIYG